MFKIERTTFTFDDLNFRPISLLASPNIAYVFKKHGVRQVNPLLIFQIFKF
jgi:hypothetical protein